MTRTWHSMTMQGKRIQYVMAYLYMVEDYVTLQEIHKYVQEHDTYVLEESEISSILSSLILQRYVLVSRPSPELSKYGLSIEGEFFLLTVLKPHMSEY